MSIVEYFLLSDAQAAAKRVPEDARVDIARTLGVAKRRAEAAERLWSNGHTAEGLRLAVAAFALTLEALPRFAGSTGGALVDGAGVAAYRKVLGERGLSERRIAGILEAEKLIAERELPVLDEEVEAADGELFGKIVQARGRLDAALSPAASTPKQLAWTRNWRIGLTVLAVVGAVVGVWLMNRRPEGVHAVASDYTNVFDGPLLLDGDVDTEWQLPDRTLGYVDITIEPPVRMNTLTLRNGHNRWYNDRAVRAYRIEVYSDGDLATTIDGEFERLEPDPEPVTHDVGVDSVSRLRFNVRSWHRIGAALAEISWE